MTGTIIATDGLTHAYGDIVALQDVSLTVPEGRIGLVGANGAGKTTFLKILLGILQPRSGSVTVLGTDVDADPLDVRARVGYMPEAESLPKDQTAADFVGYAAELAGLPSKAARQRASDVLTLVGLHEERFRPIGEFSTGMAQRTKLAQSIVHHPDLVLLDEPTSGLDPEGREEMLDMIRRLGEFGINAIVSSHVLPDIERTCDWVVMLDGGKVLRNGPLSALEVTGTVDVELLDDPAGVVVALEERGAHVTVVDGARINVTAPDDPFLLVRDVLAEQGVGLRRMAVRSTSLEDVFLGEEPPTPELPPPPGAEPPP
jgi:ABC-2 type transport system ATP-binding protein